MEALHVPLPVARLLRRSHNAKSARDAHDTAYYAYEFSLKLAAIARMPAAPGAWARPSLGRWAALVEAPSHAFHEREMLELFGWIAETAGRERGERKSLAGRELIDALVEYRNDVVGHTSTRGAAFYAKGATILRAALSVAWERALFRPRGERLVFVDTVQLDAEGTRRARVIDLHSELPLVTDPHGVEVGAEALPQRVCLRSESGLRSLHPWLVYDEENERLLCFNGLARDVEYLDYVSGATLGGAALEERFPGLSAALRSCITTSRPDSKPEAPSPSNDATRIGDFRLLARLGQGGMGIVHLARQESLGRLVALKLLPSLTADEPLAVARFEREIAALSRCEHENVIKILAAGSAGGAHYYATELVDGVDLATLAPHFVRGVELAAALDNAVAQRRAEHPELAPFLSEPARGTTTTGGGADRFRELARFFRDAAVGVQHLHDHGILHRDLKPANLMATWPDARAVVMDLGLASMEDASVSLTRDARTIVGTLRYMAPEQLQRNLVSVDRRIDVFSLGAALYELLAERPFRDGDSEARLIEQVLREEPLRLERAERHVPGDLAKIVHKAIARDPRQRYDSASAFAQDLDAFLEHRPISARPPSTTYRLRRWVQREPARATLAGVAILLVPVLTVGGGYIVSKQPQIAAAKEHSRRERVERAVRDGYTALAELKFDVARQRMETALQSDGANLEAIAGLVYADLGDQEAHDAIARLEGLPESIRMQLGLQRLYARVLQIVDRNQEASKLLVELGPPTDAMSLFIDGVFEQRGVLRGDVQAGVRAQQLLERAIYTSPVARLPYYLYLAQIAAENDDLDTARHVVEAMKRLWPKDSSVTFVEALIQLRDPLAPLKQVEAAADQAAAAFPANASALFNQALAKYDQGKYAEVIMICRQALALDPDVLLARALIAQSLYRLERYEEAKGEFEAGFEALEARSAAERQQYPRNQADARDLFGRTLMKLGDHEGAIRQFRLALELLPNLTFTRELLGDELRRAGRLLQAVVEYEIVLKQHPDNASVSRSLGYSRYRLGDDSRAVDAYERSLAADPDVPATHYLLGLALRHAKRIEDALSEFREAVRLAPDDAEYRFELGRTLLEVGRPDEALGEFNEQTRLAPEDVRAYAARGQAHSAAARFEAAVRELLRAVELDPADSFVHTSLVRAALSGKQPAVVLVELERWLERNPEDPNALNGLAWELVSPTGLPEIRDAERALELAREAVKRSNENAPEILDTLAEALFASGDAQGAVATETKALELLRKAEGTTPEQLAGYEASLARFKAGVQQR